MNKKTTVIMEQTEENGNKTPWAFVLCAPISHSLLFFRFIDILSSPVETTLIHIRSFGAGGEKKQKYVLECKIASGRVLKPTIYIYTNMHILLSASFCSTHNAFSFVHPSGDYTHLT